MRWTLSFPIDALDTQLPSSRDGSSSKITDRAEHLSTALQVANKGGDLLDAETGGSLQRYTNLTDADTVYASQQVTPIQVVLSSIPPRSSGNLPKGGEFAQT